MNNNFLEIGKVYYVCYESEDENFSNEIFLQMEKNKKLIPVCKVNLFTLEIFKDKRDPLSYDVKAGILVVGVPFLVLKNIENFSENFCQILQTQGENTIIGNKVFYFHSLEPLDFKVLNLYEVTDNADSLEI